MRDNRGRNHRGGNRNFDRRPKFDPEGRELYFIGILPTESICDELYAIKQEFADNYASSYALKVPEHLTLVPPFRRIPEMEDDYAAELEKFVASVDPFIISLNGFGAFEPRVIFVAPEPQPLLDTMQEQFTNSLIGSGLLRDEEIKLAFHPHLTVAYRDLTEDSFHEAWQEFQNRPYQGSFVADSICLMKLIKGRWKPIRRFAFGSGLV